MSANDIKRLTVLILVVIYVTAVAITAVINNDLIKTLFYAPSFGMFLVVMYHVKTNGGNTIQFAFRWGILTLILSVLFGNLGSIGGMIYSIYISRRYSQA